MSENTIIAESNGFQIVHRVLSYTPLIEHKSFETWVVILLMREIATNAEKPFEALGGESSHKNFSFTWVAPGVIEWKRYWPTGMRMSQLLGKTPITELKTLRFDFFQEHQSQIIFDFPDSRSENSYSYNYLNYSFAHDFDSGKLYFHQLSRK